MTYNRRVPLWNNSDSSHPLANFTTHFSFSQTVGDAFGTGLSFFITSSDLEPSVNAAGLNFSSHIIVVEFDSFINHAGLVDNYVTIKVNSVVCKTSVRIFLGTSRLASPLPPSTELDSVVLHDIYGWEFSAQYSWDINTQPESPPFQTNKRRNDVLLFVTACVAMLVTTMVGLALLLARWLRGNTNKLKSRELDKHFAPGPRKFSYAVLRSATNNFSNDQMLGKGGFGQVYKGFLSASKEIVAVKKLSQGSKQGQKEYISEVSIISKLRHRNLVQLHGWCHEKGHLLLVYEFLPSGSLDKYLFGEQKKGALKWERRYSITCDIASALLYLHEDWDEPVVHRDIKASNVMLDGEFKAKLGDFGLARVLERERGVSHTTVVAGTFGYLALEYIFTRKASLESDVFSFGAVCLEIACGRRAIDRSLDDHNWRLVEWVWDLYGKGKILDAADAKLGGNLNGEEMESVLLVGLLCSHPDPKARLSIRQVVDILKMKAPLPPLPPSYPETVYTTSHGPVFALSLMSNGTFCTAESAWNIESA
ncbi:L-type lectin-domain containing receptor kinase IX.1-like [Cryptomeria japonica]|uniref:L-type lectin-domain containing receptor kinase IX.1-like n=1 Tax=Cryptomeria japonica TaxID=3369 RepID=UPI0027DA0C19|nr:L-type lectin-domain containing receptor kinase IX.1-like [Cryptomeria japonica]